MIFKLDDSFNETFIVSEKTHNGFIEVFNDHNPLHTNTDFAIEKGFKGKVMHGNILNGFLSYFIGECLPTKNVIIHSQEIKFKNAVYLNDRLNLSMVISGVYDSVNAVEFKFRFINPDSLVVAVGKMQIGILE